MSYYEKIQRQCLDTWSLLLRYEIDPSHPVHVSQLATRLYDSLIPIHHLSLLERNLLECAALVHDMGMLISEKQHHKHVMRMILNTDLPSFEEREKQIMANTARYHRRSFPMQKHREFGEMEENDQQIVRTLASILRIADALDKSGQGIIEIEECFLEKREFIIHVQNRGPYDRELKALEKKKDLFVFTFGADVKLQVQPVREAEMDLPPVTLLRVTV